MTTTFVKQLLSNGDYNCFKVTVIIEKCLKTEKSTSYNILIKNSATLKKRTFKQNTSQNHQKMTNDDETTTDMVSSEHFNQKQQLQQFSQKRSKKSLNLLNCFPSFQSLNKLDLQSYKSLTNLLSQQIDDIITLQIMQEQNERKMLKNQIQQYQQTIFSYFNKIVNLQYNQQNLNIIFGFNQFSFSSYFEQDFLQGTLEQSRFLNIVQRKKMLQKLIQHRQIKSFLKIILKNMPNEINFQILFITYQIMNEIKQQMNGLSTQCIQTQILFYNDKIKYLNFRFTQIDYLDVDIKQQFQNFIQQFKILISGLIVSKQNDKVINCFPSLIDRRDFFSSDDQQDQEEVNFISGRKKIKF